MTGFDLLSIAYKLKVVKYYLEVYMQQYFSNRILPRHHRGNPLTLAQRQAILDLYNQKMPINKIAKLLGLKYSKVYASLNQGIER